MISTTACVTPGEWKWIAEATVFRAVVFGWDVAYSFLSKAMATESFWAIPLYLLGAHSAEAIHFLVAQMETHFSVRTLQSPVLHLLQHPFQHLPSLQHPLVPLLLQLRL